MTQMRRRCPRNRKNICGNLFNLPICVLSYHFHLALQLTTDY